MGHRSNRSGGIPNGPWGNKSDHQMGTPLAIAIRASRNTTLHKQAECKTASPLKLYAAETCFPWDDHVGDRDQKSHQESQCTGAIFTFESERIESLAEGVFMY